MPKQPEIIPVHYRTIAVSKVYIYDCVENVFHS